MRLIEELPEVGRFELGHLNEHAVGRAEPEVRAADVPRLCGESQPPVRDDDVAEAERREFPTDNRLKPEGRRCDERERLTHDAAPFLRRNG